MNTVQCNVCFNTLQINPQWQTVCCPYCNNTVNLMPVQNTPAFGQSQVVAPQIFLQQQGKNTLITNGDFNTVFNVVSQVMKANKVSIKKSDPMSGTISGKAPYGINPFGMSVECNFYGQNGSTMIKFNARFTDAFDTFGACSKKISEIIAGVMMQSQTIQSAAVVSYAPMVSQNHAPSPEGVSSLAAGGRVCGILGFFIPLASIVGLVMSIIALSRASSGDNSTRSVAQTGLVLSIIAFCINLVLCIILFSI